MSRRVSPRWTRTEPGPPRALVPSGTVTNDPRIAPAGAEPWTVTDSTSDIWSVPVGSNVTEPALPTQVAGTSRAESMVTRMTPLMRRDRAALGTRIVCDGTNVAVAPASRGRVAWC